MPGTALTISARPFDPADWRPYGWVPVSDTDPRDGNSRLNFEWADAHLNLIGHDADEVPRTERGLVCQMLFRHQTHTQALMVLNCPAVAVVAPPARRLARRRTLACYRPSCCARATSSCCTRELGTGGRSRSVSRGWTC